MQPEKQINQSINHSLDGLIKINEAINQSINHSLT
jgi:hypothetical protein